MLQSHSFDGLNAHNAALVSEQIQTLLAEQRDVDEWADLLDNGTEAEITKKAAAIVGNSNPIVQAKVYGKRLNSLSYTTHWNLEISPRMFWGHPRRPVIMFGTMDTLVAKFSHSHRTAVNGLCRALVDRMVRLYKLSALTADENEELRDRIFRVIHRKFWPTYQFYNAINFYHPSRFDIAEDRAWVLLNGKMVFLTQHQLEYMRQIKAIIAKTEKLDERIMLMRAAKNGK